MEKLKDIKEIKFEGICSGDGESFCWEVDKNTYIKIKGWNEDSSPYDCVNVEFTDDRPIMKSNQFRIYPNDIFGINNTNKININIKWK